MAVSHVLVLLSLVAVESIVWTGRAFYCRDPDTGKLHAVNSTWASSSFCGNYTCKLKRRNITETEYTPLRQLNVTGLQKVNETNINLNDINTESGTVAIEDDTEPSLEVVHKDKTADDNLEHNNGIKTITESETKNKETEMISSMSKINNDENKNMTEKRIKYISNKDIYTDGNLERNHDVEKTTEYEHENKEKQVIKEISSMSMNNNDNNRYLTEKEINSISSLLHTVKKSDLDAIVDIYNLAQDIYNEMDKVNSEDITNDAVNDVGDDNLKHSGKSYFYDPYNAYKSRFDLENQVSNYAVTTVQPKRNLPTYFNEVVTSQDIGNLPYYYPLSSFQRSSSYLHQPTQPTKFEKPKPCKTLPPKDTQGNAQTLIKPSYLLPYPFAYIHQYNNTNLPNNVVFSNNAYPWNNKQLQHQPYYNPYITSFPIVPNPIIMMNPHLHEDVADIEQKPIAEKNLLEMLHLKPKESKPDWKTDDLSNQVLNEVRANIDTSKLLKPFPFRNNIKLEKVGKLLKLDEMTRSRRSVDEDIVKIEAVKHKEPREVTEVIDHLTPEEPGEYETYLEKTTCQATAVPGYFRYGNLTQPFPECCPQLINHR